MTQKDVSNLQDNRYTLLDFPDEILVHIFSYLSKKEIFWKMGLTCKKLFNISCEFNTIIEIRDDNMKESKMSQLNDISNYLEVLHSVSHLVVWSYPEDYVSLNESFYLLGCMRGNRCVGMKRMIRVQRTTQK